MSPRKLPPTPPSSRLPLVATVSLLLAWLLIAAAHAAPRVAPGPQVVTLTSAADEKPLGGVTVNLGGRYAQTTPVGVATFHGVPAGEYALGVAHLGYERVARQVTLPAGAREPLALALKPVAQVAVTGQVILDGDGRPLAGAQVSLRPVAVAAAVQGPFHFAASWDGKFSVPEVVPGRYAAEVSAAGCATLSTELEVAPDMPPVEWKLKRVEGSQDLTVIVQDALSGAVLPGARVTVAEAWPRGIIAEGVSDAQGKVSFPALATARLNWEKVALATSVRGLWTVENHLLNLLGEGTTINGWRSLWDSPFEGTMSGDGRSMTGRLRSALGNWSQDYALSSALNEDGSQLVERYGLWGEEANKDGWRWVRVNTSTTTAIGSGLTLAVEAAGHERSVVALAPGASGTQILKTSPTATVEEQEPNNEPGAAQDLPRGATVQFKLATAGDQDCFRFRLPSPGRAEVELRRNSLWVHVSIVRADGKELAQWGATGGDVSYFEAPPLAAGDYVVRVWDWNNTGTSPDPMALRITTRRAPDPWEPNDDPANARPIRPGQELRGSIHPVGDVDWYRFEMKRPGMVRFWTPWHPMWRWLSITNSAGEEIAREGLSGREGAVKAQLSPGEYRVSVREWNNVAAFLEPYTLRMEMLEDDGVDDTVQPTAGLVASRELGLGDQVSDTLFPAGDNDYYRVTIPQAGRLRAWLTKSPDLWNWLFLRNAQGEELTRVGVSSGTGELSWDAQGPTTVYLHVREWNDSAGSTNPHVLRTLFEPCDELEALARNDTMDTASPLELGEKVEATLYPGGDDDWYAVTADFAGVLRIKGRTRGQYWSSYQLYDSKGNVVSGSRQSNNGQEFVWDTPVLAGNYAVRVTDWNDHDGSPLPYDLQVNLVRAEPQEMEPLRADGPRRLKIGEAQAFYLDQNGDRDTFILDTPADGKYAVVFRKPPRLWVYLSVYDDRTGQEITHWGVTGGGVERHELEAKGPTRYRFEIRDWNDNGADAEPGYIAVDDVDRPMAQETLIATADPNDPTRVSFSRKPQGDFPRATLVAVDPGAGDKAAVQVPVEGAGEYRYPSEGLFRATALLKGEGGMLTRVPLWVEATGPRERTGVQLMVDRPSEGQVVDQDAPVQVRAISYTGAKIARVTADVDGTALPAAFSAPYSLAVPWSSLAPGAHTLTVRAVDTSGAEAKLARKFSVSEYFGLQPQDGSTLSGNAVRVSWSGGRFGPARVRFRAKDATEWQEAVGESGRDRAVSLAGLEAGKVYEFQPLGGTDPGPVRTVTRVKGLAFGKTRYGANIARDYDQRVPVSVRNHGEQPLQVNLVCGKPETPDLLVSFVGEGSEDKPVDLGPGEEREFTLVFSAQDAIHPDFRVPLRITGTGGFSDEVELEVHVKLPEVKLAWEELGETEYGSGKRYRLINQGDGLTDLVLRSESPDLSVSPAVEHGMLPAGGTMEVCAYPRLYDGYKGVEGRITAGAVGKTVPCDVKLALKEGEQVFGVWVTPGSEGADPDQADLLEARRLSGATLSAAYVDWSKATDPQDTDSDGRADRWTWTDRLERIQWTGEDTDADGKVDFARADVGYDGQEDYAGMLGPKGWEPTNYAGGSLEMGFQLRGPVESYQPHDVDIVLNDQVVGALKDTLPQGNYNFRLPASALQWNTVGSPEGNQLGIRSRHLRGGHYAVTSDFRMKVRLTSTRAWVVAGSEEQARERMRSTPGLTTGAPDVSVSSHELTVLSPPQPKAGDVVTVVARLRNMGALPAKDVCVAVLREDAWGSPVELARQYVEAVPVTGVTPVEVALAAPAGSYSLRVQVDPEQALPDLDRENNSAVTTLKVEGDTTPPTLKLTAPADAATQKTTVLDLAAEAADETGLARVEVRLDNGLWSPLSSAGAGRYQGKMLAQPGAHRVTARAIDRAGNRVEAAASVQVDVPVPTARITAPAEGAKVEQRKVTVSVACGPEVVLAGVRVNGGAWQRATLNAGVASAEVGLRFGECALEVMVADKLGAQSISSCRITCTKQREETDTATGGAATDAVTGAAGTTDGLAAGGGARGGTVNVDGLGPVDVFGPNGGSGTTAVAGGAAVPGGGVTGGAEGGAAPVPEDEDGDEHAAAPGGGGGGAGPDLDEDTMEELDEAEAEPEEADLDGEEWLDEDGADLDPGVELPEAGPEEPEGDVGDFMGDVGEYPHPDGEVSEEPGDEAADELPPPPPANPPATAGTVAVQQRQTDWYCTNRPAINVKFQLPDWLKKLHLPRPGTPEYDAAVKKMLDRLKAQGIDTAPFEKFQEALRRKTGSLQSPDELPGFLESLGLAGPKPTDPAELQAWRDKMREGVDGWYLRLLASGDPKMLAAGLKARGEALGQFDKALQDSADACMTQIKGNQKLVEDCLMAVPHTNLALFIATWNEKESLSGEQITKCGRFINGVFALTWGVGKLFQNPAFRAGMASIGNKAAWMGESAIASLATRLKLPPGKLKDALGYVQKGLENLRGKLNGGLSGKIGTAGKNFANSPAGQAAKKQLEADVRAADRLLRRISQAQNGGDKRLYRQLIVELQGNKTAQGLLNSSKYSAAFRTSLDKTHRAMGRLADRRTIRELMGAAQKGEGDAGKALQALLRKNPGLKAGDVTMRARTVTGVKVGGYGRDRDVVYQWVTKDGKVLGDVHHSVSGPAYSRSIQGITGRTAKQMDHVVTSRWHPDAYNPGRFKDPRNAEQAIKEIIQGKRAGNLARPGDIRDTVIEKGKSLFDEAKTLTGAEANRATTEGMRQVLKDYERHVAGYLKNRGLNPNTALPPRLKQGLDIFRQVQEGVQNGSCTVEQANAMLGALGKASRGGTPVSPTTIVEDLGAYIEFINKWGLKAG